MNRFYRLIKLNGTDITRRTGSHELTGYISELPILGHSFILYNEKHPGGGVITSPVAKLDTIAENHYRFNTLSGSTYILTLEAKSSVEYI